MLYEIWTFVWSFVVMLAASLIGYRVIGPAIWRYVTFNRGWRGFNIDDME